MTTVECVAKAIVGHTPYERMTDYGRKESDDRARKVLLALVEDKTLSEATRAELRTRI